jgi:hypothetical protein
VHVGTSRCPSGRRRHTRISFPTSFDASVVVTSLSRPAIAYLGGYVLVFGRTRQSSHLGLRSVGSSSTQAERTLMLGAALPRFVQSHLMLPVGERPRRSDAVTCCAYEPVGLDAAR